MSRPLCVDLFAGSFGWSAGWLELGGYVVGFDLTHEAYHGPVPKGADLVLQDVRTLHGSQFKDAALILASSPCQEFSYRAMPWKRAKALGPPLLGMELFAQAARIQKEASDAVGHRIPMIQENVRGAQKYVGRAAWRYGSFFLWGDVPALMPFTHKGVKVPTMGAGWYPPDHPKHVAGLGFNTHADRQTRRADVGQGARFTSRDCGIEGTKDSGGSWFAVAHNTTSGHSKNPVHDGIKQAGLSGPRVNGKGDGWFEKGAARHGSKSNARKAASAAIAKIPAPLARWIAQTFYPREQP